MDIWEQIKERFKIAGFLLVIFFLDGLLILAFGSTIAGVKYALETWILKCPLEESENNEPFKIIYYLSEYILVILFAIFILRENFRTVRKMFLKQGKK
jgi:hypothetical protein